jgi:hypothetical protein
VCPRPLNHHLGTLLGIIFKILIVVVPMTHVEVILCMMAARLDRGAGMQCLWFGDIDCRSLASANQYDPQWKRYTLLRVDDILKGSQHSTACVGSSYMLGTNAMEDVG